jgi:hypothetical protein
VPVPCGDSGAIHVSPIRSIKDRSANREIDTAELVNDLDEGRDHDNGGRVNLDVEHAAEC